MIQTIIIFKYKILSYFNNDKINNNRLTVPHYDMKRRDFVIVPLFEIDPSLILPDGDLISDVMNNLQVNKLQKIKQIKYSLYF